jgi:hypothetical protein
VKPGQNEIRFTSQILFQYCQKPLSGCFCNAGFRLPALYNVQQAPQVVSHLLAGSLLINTERKIGILINEVEVYGRREVDDCHREQLGLIKGFSMETSMPSTFGEDAYKDVHPVVVSPREGGGKRLVIGTRKCDVLVTSCLRLDQKSISVGGETHIFPIGEQDARRLKIYLDTERVKEARQFLEMSPRDVLKTLSVENLRQLRSRFDQPCQKELAKPTRPSRRVSKSALKQCDRHQ